MSHVPTRTQQRVNVKPCSSLARARSLARGLCARELMGATTAVLKLTAATALMLAIVVPTPGEEPISLEPNELAEDDYTYWLQLRQRDGLPLKMAAPIIMPPSAAPKTKKRPRRASKPSVSAEDAHASQPAREMHIPPAAPPSMPPPAIADASNSKASVARAVSPPPDAEECAAVIGLPTLDAAGAAPRCRAIMPASTKPRMPAPLPLQPAGPQLVRPSASHKAGALPPVPPLVPPTTAQAAPPTTVQAAPPLTRAEALTISLRPRELRVRRRANFEGNNGFTGIRPSLPVPPVAAHTPPVRITLEPRDLVVRRCVPLSEAEGVAGHISSFSSVRE